MDVITSYNEIKVGKVENFQRLDSDPGEMRGCHYLIWVVRSAEFGNGKIVGSLADEFIGKALTSAGGRFRRPLVARRMARKRGGLHLSCGIEGVIPPISNYYKN